MSKHVRVPAPIQKVIPRIIRSTTGRLFLLVGSCAAVLAFGGSHYLLTRTTVTPKTTKPSPSADAKVLGSATTEHLDDATKPETAQTTSTPATPQATTPTPTGQASSKDSHEKQSFEVDIDSSKITTQGLSTVLVPFTIERHGGFAGVIVPGNVDLTVNGTLSSLVSVQSSVMTGPDTGLITLTTVGLGRSTVNGHFSASSGNLTAPATFSYTPKK